MNYDQIMFNAGMVRGFEVGNLPEPVNVAFGVEARRESYQHRGRRTGLVRPRARRRRTGRRAGLPGLPAQQ